VRTALPAWRIAFAARAYAVVELPAGTLARSETAARAGLSSQTIPSAKQA